MKIWTNINKIFDSVANTTVALARTTEKTVVLAEREVDLLSLQQQQRIEEEEYLIKQQLLTLHQPKSET